MRKTDQNASVPQRKRRPAAKTLEGRENQMISLAIDVAEQQLMDGTASAAVITHYLKLGTTRERLEQEKLRNENLKLQAAAKRDESAQNSEEMYINVLEAIRTYSGRGDSDD